MDIETTLNFELNEIGNILKISEGNESDNINPDIYCLKYLISKSDSISSLKDFKWISNKYLKPNFYGEHLFVSKTRAIWKNLLIDIFRSKVYMEVRDSLFNQSQIDIFKVDEFISNIIDNIKFFIYNTTFLGNTNKESNTIYEYGMYNLEINNHSVALLIFYGFHIIINIHEIGGHLNIRYQYYISLDESFHSPDITSDKKHLYTNYAQDRKQESGETIEIKLFGQVKYSLTIKEALFVLNKENYKLSVEEFKNNFQKCNDKSLGQLLNDSLKELLSNLGINVADLSDSDKYSYNYPTERKTNAINSYYENKPRHPFGFYYDNADYFKRFFELFGKSSDDIPK